jgi:DNA helicase-2/ATP-dependent DNA helicase PcrA
MELTDAQLEAINLTASPMQITACAGSGKTEVLARRTARLLLEGTPPGSIVAFTFTEKAAGELKDRINERAAENNAKFKELPPTSAGLFVGTIHSYCLRLLQEHGGIHEMFDPLTDEREWALLQRFARRLGIVDLMSTTWPNQKVSVKRAVQVFRSNLSVVYNERIPREIIAEKAPAYAEVINRYEELLDKMQLISFDQMIEKACRELGQGGRLRHKLQGRVLEVLVDEYQDLNRAQENLLKSLMEMGAKGTVVGDDDQAIYQWRGGDVSLFFEFPERYPGAVIRGLEHNHRSVPAIIKVANGFAGTIGERRQKSMAPVHLDAGPAVELMKAGTAEHEAELLVQRIQSLINTGIQPADIAVLYRSVRTSAGPLYAGLRREGIPVALVGRLSLLDRPEMALLARVFTFWSGGVWQPELDQEVVTRESLVTEVASVTGVNLNKARHTVAELERMGGRLAGSSIDDLIGTYLKILEVLSLPGDSDDRQHQENGLGQLSRLLGDFEHAQRRRAPLELLQAHAESASEETAEDSAILGDVPGLDRRLAENLGLTYGNVFLTRLRVFLEQFASQAAEEALETPILDGGAINIMTVHQAKGLEFPVVIVPSLVDKRFPSSRMGEPKFWYLTNDLFDKVRYEGKEDDERRLFYVAMTRARDLLILSWFTQYEKKAATPSRFIRNVAQYAENACFAKAGECAPQVFVRSNGDTAIMDTDFSQVLTYAECPYKYYLRYVCGFMPPIAIELGFGKALHHVVAELARESAGSKAPTLEDVDRILAESFYLPFAGPIAFEQLHSAARRRLSRYVESYGEELIFTRHPEHRIEVPMETARIRGRIDLVLQAKEGHPEDVVLIDFKTSANRPPSMHHQNQIRMYAEAVKALGMNPVKLAIHDLDDENGERIDIDASEEIVEAFRADLAQILQNITKGKFSRKKSKTGCSACDFTVICAKQN